MQGKAVLAVLLLVLPTLVWIIPISPVAAQSSRKWTFMVYMDADNNLDSAGVDDLCEMQNVGSSSDVAVVALFDRWHEECGTNGSAILHIQPEGNNTLWGGWSEEYELNMGDPQTLSWFINYTVEAFPAERYALILWDHGGNWEGICWDWTSDDFLTIEEVKGALLNSTVDRVDLLGFDACLMGSVEVAYTVALSGKVGVMVGSEDSVPWDGWPYNAILEGLVQSPSWAEHELSIDIIDQYVASYSKIGWAKVFTTMSAIDLTQMDIVVSYMDALTEELLIGFSTYKDAITNAKNSADRHWFGAWHQGPYIDLYNFIHQLGRTEDTLKAFTDPIIEAWSELVIYSKCCSGPHNRGGKGLTVYFPRNRNSFYTPELYYESTPEFADETNWNALLTTFFGS